MELRKLFRILAVVGAVVFSAYQALAARRDYREWQESVKIGDHGIDFYRLNFEIDCAEIMVAWGFAGALIYVLRSRTTAKS